MISDKAIAPKQFFRNKLLKWGRDNFSEFPWRSTENKWHALVAEIMLQRTRAEQVLPVYTWFVKKYKSPQQYLNNCKTDVFKSLGLPAREKQLRLLAGTLIKIGIPCGKNELLELPCVGEYIASAFRSLHLNIRDVIIDANVVRIYGRFWGFKTNADTRRKSWLIELAGELTPQRAYKTYNYGLIDFTRTICKPVNPSCSDCVFKNKCSHA